ncbi:MAG: NAD-dependent epimerase/dehydratase family protein [Microbacterium sp.]|nr:NAD-dependent epimerase/dehydratase family protein [Microbacterium sp.]
MNEMDGPSVFVTGATGSVGSAVVAHLASKGQRVVAAVRNDSAVDFAAGVAKRPFAFSGDADTMKRALEGCDRLFLMRPPPSKMSSAICSR